MQQAIYSMSSRKFHILDEFSGQQIAKFPETDCVRDWLTANARFEVRRIVLHTGVIVVTKQVNLDTPSLSGQPA